MPRPDILIARNGELVALRGRDGKLSALPARQAKFELERWLESDGDARKAPEVQNARAFTCDGVGCIARIKGVTIAVSKSGAALADDCAKAEVVILAEPRPKGCDGGAQIFDLFDVWRNGTHALYIEHDDGGGPSHLRVDTVAAHRGDRPWAPLLKRHEDRLPKPRVAVANSAPADGTDVDVDPSASGLPNYAARPEWLSPVPARPELDDDNGDLSAPSSDADQ